MGGEGEKRGRSRPRLTCPYTWMGSGGRCAARRLRGGSSGAPGGTRSSAEPPPAAPPGSSSSNSSARRCGGTTVPFAPPLLRVAMFVARGRAAPCGTDGAAPPPGQNVQWAPPRRPVPAPRALCSPPPPPSRLIIPGVNRARGVRASGKAVNVRLSANGVEAAVTREEKEEVEKERREMLKYRM